MAESERSGQASPQLAERHARRPGWYVVQVLTGQEAHMVSEIERACAEHDAAARGVTQRVGLRECFSPRFQSQEKWKGDWRDVERPLLPGYVIVDVERPAMLAQALRPVRDLCRVLSAGERYEPLRGYEREWMEANTQRGNRVMPMSFGYREGDVLTVERGPLRGREAQIVRTDRANSLAHIELHVGSVTIKTTVGLGIVPRK